MSHWKLEDIYAHYRQALFTLALSRTGHIESAEDAVHEAFVRLCRRGLTSASDPVSYVFAAVRNAAIDRVRRPPCTDQWVEPSKSLFDERVASPEDDALRAETEELVCRAIDSLPADQREIVVLRVYGGLKFVQIAQIIDAPIQTVCTRYQRALGRLRISLERFV